MSPAAAIAPVPSAAVVQTPEVSVIVRARNVAPTLTTVVTSIREQTVPAEVVIVVDLSSSDETLTIARQVADTVVEMPVGSFSYGRALNVGAGAASCPVQAALSAHSPYPHPGWLRGAAAHISRGALAAAGAKYDGEMTPLTAPFEADNAYLRSHPFWGLSNHASAWSADAWRRHRFDETLPASEDIDWSWRATAGGGYVVLDPELVVPHLTRNGRGYLPRRVREMRAADLMGAQPPLTFRSAWHQLADPVPETAHPELQTRPFGRPRLTELAARVIATVRPH